MSFTRLELQNLRNNSLSHDLVAALLETTDNIAFAKVASDKTPFKKMLADIVFIDEIRYLNAHYHTDYTHKEILLSLCTESNSTIM